MKLRRNSEEDNALKWKHGVIIKFNKTIICWITESETKMEENRDIFRISNEGSKTLSLFVDSNYII